MTAVNRALERLDHNYPYIAIGALVATVVGIALSSVILKVAGVALAAIALLGFIHQKCFLSKNSSVPSINNPSFFAQPTIPEPVDQLVAEVLASPETPTVLPSTTQEPIHITDSITSADQIPAIASINGVLIQEIERRARPAIGQEGVKTEGWSYSGFLGMNESFKDVLSSDWTTVRALGWTHKDLADHLSNIVNAVRATEDNNHEVELNYNHRNEQISLKLAYKHLKYEPYYSNNTDPRHELRACYARHRGRQEDIFSPEKDAYENAWNGVCYITNVSTGAKVIWTPGVERYIRKYGFYEGGGKSNHYRVDPIALISILTGETEVDLRKKLTPLEVAV